MGDDIKEQGMYERNKGNIAGKEVDVSVEALSRKRNINLPKDFADSLQSADFYSSEKAMPAQYPLLLLSNVATVMVMKEIGAYLINSEAPVENTVNVYVKQRSGGKEVATPVGRVNLSLKFLDTLNYFLVEYTYYIAKGQKAEIERASLVDYREFNPIIDPGEDVMSYADINRVPPREKSSIGLQTFGDILRELQEAQESAEGGVAPDIVIPDVQGDKRRGMDEKAQEPMPTDSAEELNTGSESGDKGQSTESAESRDGVDAISWNE